MASIFGTNGGFGTSIFGANPVSDWVAPRRNALMGLSAGFLAGDPSAAMRGAMQGSALDQQYAQEQAQLAEEAQAKNSTLEWLKQQGYTDLVAGVEGGGLDMGTAWSEALRRGQPKAPQAPIKVSAGETLLDPTTMQPIYQGAPDQKDAFGYEKDLFSQYSGSDPVKVYEEVKNGYERVRQSSALQTGAGDMGLIYGYMKMLDPGSVVRETEFAMAAQAGSYGEQIQGLVQRILSGERLPESVRAQFVEAAEGLYGETAANLEGINQQFETRANTYGVNPSTFIRRPEQFKPLQGIVTMPNGNTVRPL